MPYHLLPHEQALVDWLGRALPRMLCMQPRKVEGVHPADPQVRQRLLLSGCGGTACDWLSRRHGSVLRCRRRRRLQRRSGWRL
jgi:hypothetical protein